MKISKKSLGIAIGILLVSGIGIVGHTLQMNKLFNKTSSTKINTNQSLEQILDNSPNFKLEKQIFSFKKHYYIIVDDTVVGEVTGRNFPIFGEKLVMTDNKGNVIRNEYQVKRSGFTNEKIFNVSIDRLGVIKDSKNDTIGYIGEEKLKDFWKFNQIQCFYDLDGKKIGSAKPKFFLLSEDYKILDSNNNIDYIVDGNVWSLASKSTVIKKDNSNIDEESAILYTIIENSISYGSAKKSSSKAKQ